MNSYASSMRAHRSFSSVFIIGFLYVLTAETRGRRVFFSKECPASQRPCGETWKALCFWRRGAFNHPTLRVVVLEEIFPADVAEDHALGDPELLRANRKVDVRDCQADESDACQPVK